MYVPAVYCLSLYSLGFSAADVFSSIPQLLESMPEVKRGSQGLEHHQGGGEKRKPPTFLSLKDHLVELVIKGILSERDHHNKQLLLHALNVIILDIGE